MEGDQVENSDSSNQTKPAPVSQNVLEGEDENFMNISTKEKAAWIKMIKTRHAALVKREQDHKKWHEGLIQRRVDVFNRSRKLLNAQRDRFRFLFKMTEVVKNLTENNNNHKSENSNNNDNNNDNNNNSEQVERRGDDNNNTGNANSTDDSGARINESDDSKDNSSNTAGTGEVGEGGNSIPTIMVNEPSQ